MTPSELAEWLDRRGMLYDEEAAATIRAQAEALKIATEALDAARMASSEYGVIVQINEALARIKEVG